MTIEEAFEFLRFDDADILATAGPAVLRLKLLEATAIFQRRIAQDQIREAAEIASAQLKELIAERPCVSLADVNAREKMSLLSKTLDRGRTIGAESGDAEIRA